jgi:hypothetical protein
MARRVAAEEFPGGARVAEILVARFLHDGGAKLGHGLPPGRLDLRERLLVAGDGGEHHVVKRFESLNDFWVVIGVHSAILLYPLYEADNCHDKFGWTRLSRT